MSPNLVAGFASVTMAGACFEDSVLFRIWSTHYGVRFERDRSLDDSFRYLEHQNGPLLTIISACPEDWSKNLRDKDDRRVWKAIIEATKKEMGQDRFLWSANKDVPDHIFSSDPDHAKRLPHQPHGLNDFMDYDNVVFLSAYDPPPAHFAFLGWMGIDSEGVKTAISRQQVYQAVMRCSLRDPDNKEPKRVIVSDHSTRVWLSPYFPGSTERSLDVDFGDKPLRSPRGRTRLHEGDSRKQVYKEKRKQELLDQLEILQRVINSKDDHIRVADGKLGDEYTNKEHFVSRFSHGSIFANIFETIPFMYCKGRNIDEIVGLLKKVHKLNVATKEAGVLISPTFYDPTLSTDSNRGAPNVVFSRGIWLDNDGGDLTHKEFADLFPHVRIVVFNSFSSTKAKPRWRVYIPTTTIMTGDVYKAITTEIIKVVSERGYPLVEADPNRPDLKAHGFDTGKLRPTDLFYLPCQANDPNGNIWKDYKNEGRKPVDPEEWIKFAQIEVPDVLTHDGAHACQLQHLTGMHDKGEHGFGQVARMREGAWER